jgi:hypothetical protein
LAGGDTNLYAYVGNDPVNHLDPRGADSDDGTLAPLGPMPSPSPLPTLAPLGPEISFDGPLGSLVSLEYELEQIAQGFGPNDPLAPLVPPAPANNPGNKVPCNKPRIIWVKLGNDPWMPWYVTPTAAWPANPMGPW